MNRSALGLLVSLCICLGSYVSAAEYDLVINNGRVMDPESGLDAIRNLGISEGTIAAITESALEGDEEIDATGLVVAPGFIDLHAHGQDPLSRSFQAADGVTTALELEIGVLPVANWLESQEGTALINYGASAGHLPARFNEVSGESIGNPVLGGALTGERTVDFAGFSPDETRIESLTHRLEEGLLQGGLGIGLGISYTPGASHSEIFRVFELAASYDVPIFVHLRNSAQLGGDALAPLQEVIANAIAHDTSLHVVHLNSSLDKLALTAMQMIRGARALGLDVTTESYPYTAGSTRIESAIFDNFQGEYSQLQWTETGERLNAETFAQYRHQGGWVIIHGRDEEDNRWLVAQEDVMVASDGVPFVGGASHPRSAGTFSKILGQYVREENALSLMQALAKMTIHPARRLERFAPAMQLKGRLKTGADADITVFDPARVTDHATYLDPAQPSSGIEYVLVNGVAVIEAGELQEGIFPGQAITSSVTRND